MSGPSLRSREQVRKPCQPWESPRQKGRADAEQTEIQTSSIRRELLHGSVSRLVFRACGSCTHAKAERLHICIPQVSTQRASAGCHLCHRHSTFVHEALENYANLNDFYFPNSVSMLTSLAVPWSSGQALLQEKDGPGFLTCESVSLFGSMYLLF